VSLSRLLLPCVPLLTRALGGGLNAAADRLLWHRPAAWLATTRIAQSPGTVAAALAGVVASFALSSAMAIMVSSFRISVADWLDAVLPADLYARAPAAAGAPLDDALQRAIAATPGVARAEFLRTVELTLDPERPAVALLIRDIDPATPQRQLPLTGEALVAPPGAIPVWVSEPMLDRYRIRPGARIELPIGQDAPAAGAPPRFFVAGVWRDYARQHGAVTMSSTDWRRLGGAPGASDVALWVTPGIRPDTVIAEVTRNAPNLAALEWRTAADIRALSLRIFDRSFAVTYALEAIAILVGLFGVAAACAGEALARAREFGMLRHLGVRRRQIAAQLAQPLRAHPRDEGRQILDDQLRIAAALEDQIAVQDVAKQLTAQPRAGAPAVVGPQQPERRVAGEQLDRRGRVEGALALQLEQRA
jgi:putative ABC transport system permease protein